MYHYLDGRFEEHETESLHEIHDGSAAIWTDSDSEMSKEAQYVFEKLEKETHLRGPKQYILDPALFLPEGVTYCIPTRVNIHYDFCFQAPIMNLDDFRFPLLRSFIQKAFFKVMIPLFNALLNRNLCSFLDPFLQVVIKVEKSVLGPEICERAWK